MIVLLSKSLRRELLPIRAELERLLRFDGRSTEDSLPFLDGTTPKVGWIAVAGLRGFVRDLASPVVPFDFDRGLESGPRNDWKRNFGDRDG
jgi:hypothetical protein